MLKSKSKLNYVTIVCALGLSSVLACAHNPPQELVDARAAYQRASSGPASRLAPADLDTAKDALANAEKAFKDHPGDAMTRDWAYVAQRKAQLAEEKAGKEAADQQKVAAAKQVETEMKNKIDSTKQELAASQRENQQAEVDAAAQQADATKNDLAASKEALNAEKKARASAEEEKNDLANSLAQIAKVKEEDRGTVISLSGSVLFASGQSALLPASTAALDRVATALAKRTNQMITVEGHTDSVGSDSRNQTLSEARAEAVRHYLISAGIPASRVTAVGYGKTRPIADNSTADGRATNRRVEIVLSPNQS